MEVINLTMRKVKYLPIRTVSLVDR
jgi:hypothetical protein